MEDMQTKICTKCNKELPLNQFHKDKSNKDGLTNVCKNCAKQYYIENQEKILAYKKKHREEHKEEISTQSKEYYKKYKEEINQRRVARRKENREQLNIISKEYYKEHKEEISKRRKDIYKQNKEKYKDKNNKYYQEHKEEIQIIRNKRRSKIKGNGGFYSIDQWEECLCFFDNKCSYSGEEFDSTYSGKISKDHIIAIDNGGTSFIWNIIPARKGYNSSKNIKAMEEWYKKQPFFSEERLQRIYEWQKYAYEKWGYLETQTA